jgi:hypothetical protein
MIGLGETKLSIWNWRANQLQLDDPSVKWVSQNVKGKVKQSKRNVPPDVSPPIPSEANHSLSGTIFPDGPCCLGVDCVGTQLCSVGS